VLTNAGPSDTSQRAPGRRVALIFSLAFAPVGATLYYVETRDGSSRGMKGTGE
jgi:hypothetical protein